MKFLIIQEELFLLAPSNLRWIQWRQWYRLCNTRPWCFFFSNDETVFYMDFYNVYVAFKKQMACSSIQGRLARTRRQFLVFIFFLKMRPHLNWWRTVLCSAAKVFCQRWRPGRFFDGDIIELQKNDTKSCFASLFLTNTTTFDQNIILYCGITNSQIDRVSNKPDNIAPSESKTQKTQIK